MLKFKNLSFLALVLGTAVLGSSSAAEASRYDAPPAEFNGIIGETSARNARAAFSETGLHAVLLSPRVAVCTSADARDEAMWTNISFYGEQRTIHAFRRVPNAGPGGNDLGLLLLNQPINNVAYATVYGFNGEDMTQFEQQWGTSYSRGPIYRSTGQARHFQHEARVHMGRIYLGAVMDNELLVAMADGNPQGTFGNSPAEIHRKAVPVAGDEGSPVYFYQNSLKLVGLVTRTHPVNELNRANQTASYALLAGHRHFIQFQLAYVAAHGGFGHYNPPIVNNNNNINNNNNNNYAPVPVPVVVAQPNNNNVPLPVVVAQPAQALPAQNNAVVAPDAQVVAAAVKVHVKGIVGGLLQTQAVRDIPANNPAQFVGFNAGNPSQAHLQAWAQLIVNNVDIRAHIMNYNGNNQDVRRGLATVSIATLRDHVLSGLKASILLDDSDDESDD